MDAGIGDARIYFNIVVGDSSPGAGFLVVVALDVSLHLYEELRRQEQPLDGLSQSSGVSRRNDEAMTAVADHFGKSADVGGNDWLREGEGRHDDATLRGIDIRANHETGVLNETSELSVA